MEYSTITREFILQPNEVLEHGQLRITNLSRTAEAITFELLTDYDSHPLSGGPRIERGLEFRLRV